MSSKQCNTCKEVKDFEYFHNLKSSPDGKHGTCKECTAKRTYRNSDRMWVNGVFIPKSHPLHKPGRYKTLDDAWSHCEIDSRSKEGEVYIIRSPAYCNWYKVGKAVNSEDRLSGYQTSSPHRDFVLEYCEHFDNRHEAEAEIHRLLEKHEHCMERKGEWFKTYIPTIKEVMNEYRKQTDTRHRDQPCPQHDLDLCHAGC